MTRETPVLGVIGGTGMLGRAMIFGLLSAGMFSLGDIRVLSRSGAPGPLDPGAATLFTDTAAFLQGCDVVLYSVPPSVVGDWHIEAGDCLVLSVMAGITRARLTDVSGSDRVIRAMSSPAAARQLAFSPWIASDAATAEDRTFVQRLFASIGTEAEVSDEDHIDQFTALTGPVPGFVAAFAEALHDYATSAGISAAVTDLALRQLFLASGEMMAADERGATAQVQEMIDYDGTTAAGLRVLRDGPFKDAVAEALRAAYARTKTIG